MYKLILPILLVILTHVWSAPSDQAVISSSLFKTIREHGPVDIVISMRDKSSTAIDLILSQSFATRGARINSVASTLQAHAKNSQKSVLEFLGTLNVEFKSFWISNKIFVKNANLELINTLAKFSSIESIRNDRVTPEPFFKPLSNQLPAKSSNQGVEWGLEQMRVPEVWEQGFTGQGVVVGVIDSGVRGTHNRLVKNFRRERGWLDTTSGLEDPYDLINHGTIITGCLLGSDGIGVAPGAQWIACGSQFDSNVISDLHKCAEFMLCPTHPNGTEPDCESAPHIVTNSYGFDADEDFFDDALVAWKAAGIIAVFSNGNSGSSCDTAGYPANVGVTHFSVGATDREDKITWFSSKGPGRDGILNPNIVAPGYDITSSSHEHDDAMVYGSMGTSEAAPYVAGVIALLLSNGTELSYSEVSKYIFEGASQTVPPTGSNCGGIPETQYPNNVAGYGRISAAGALSKLLQSRTNVNSI